MIVFVTGGMWIIGYKAWGALLAMTLMRKGSSSRPWTTATSPRARWATWPPTWARGSAGCGGAASLGGDRRRCLWSARARGAFVALALLRQTEWQRSEYSSRCGAASSSSVGASGFETAAGAWSSKHFAGFVGVSGVYSPDDPSLVEHFDRKGLYREVFYAIMEAGFSGSRAFEALPRSEPCAPIVRGSEEQRAGRRGRRPCRPTLLCHDSGHVRAAGRVGQVRGGASEVRREAGAREVLPGEDAHGPVRDRPDPGGRDALTEDIARFVRGGDGEDGAFAEGEASPPLLPRALVAVARTMVPFNARPNARLKTRAREDTTNVTPRNSEPLRVSNDDDRSYASFACVFPHERETNQSVVSVPRRLRGGFLGGSRRSPPLLFQSRQLLLLPELVLDRLALRVRAFSLMS